ncbi:hypothetical protein DWB79_05815 [Treponema medium]|uniref:Uncharacterized protein n=2 Tax=Treponema medium TaxID=58231 RepID=A0AA87NUF7_TREMD|nr:hypothetical protein [Treponema medium]EPF28906.1 hypothetical protein HMPREF9195_01147 [Treponema medium ATCC 700293]QSH97271.1 hypothetical protein DWB79_05815 [Treponema medium]
MNGVLIPQRIFVGDTAQFLFPLSEKEYKTLTARGFTVDIPIPLKNLTQSDVMTINEIRIVSRESGYYLAITFVPWETGEIEFPALTFLQLYSKLPAISVSSLLGTGERVSLQPPKPPLLPPGTDFLLYGAAIVGVGLLVVLGTGVWLLFRKLRRRTLGTAKHRLAALRKQLKRLYKAARKIQKHLPSPVAASSLTNEISKNTKTAIESWYANIDRCLREYIQALYMDNTIEASTKDEAYFLSATYTELTETLTELFAPKRNIADLFCIFYAMLEQQRFASTASDLIRNYTAVSQDMLKQVPRIAEKAEAEYALLT